MKTRLNSYSRDSLMALAKSVIKCPAEEISLAAAYAKAATLVRAAVEAQLPPKDMKVLLKYGKAEVDDCIKVSGAGSYYSWFHFEKGLGPLSLGCRTFLVDGDTTAAVIAWEKAKESRDDAIRTKINDYQALIQASRYFEDVLEIWPEAEKLRGDIGLNTVSTISLDVLDRIKADISTRVALAEKS